MRLARSLPLHILRSTAYIAVAQPEALVFSIYMRLCNVTHRQKERQQREQMSPHLIYIALCVLTTPDRETLQIMGYIGSILKSHANSYSHFKAVKNQALVSSTNQAMYQVSSWQQMYHVTKTEHA